MDHITVTLGRLMRHRDGGPRGPGREAPRGDRVGAAPGSAPPRPWLPPGDPVMVMAMAGWPDELLEAWEERASIMEYDGGLPRDAAERAAFEAKTRGN